MFMIVFVVHMIEGFRMDAHYIILCTSCFALANKSYILHVLFWLLIVHPYTNMHTNSEAFDSSVRVIYYWSEL